MTNHHMTGARVLAVTAAFTLATVGVRAQELFEISNVNSNLVLDVPGFSTHHGERIWQWPENGYKNQQWFLRWKGAGYEIVNVWSQMVLDVPNFSHDTGPNTWIQQWDENGGANQLWTLKGLPGTGFLPYFAIVSVNSPWMALDVPSFSTTVGQNIQQWPENDYTNQQWSFIPVGPLPDIHVDVTRSQLGPSVTISGSGFPVGWALKFRYMGIPGHDGPFGGAETIVDARGSFSSHPAAFQYCQFCNTGGYVTVGVEDLGGNVLGLGYTFASYWRP